MEDGEIEKAWSLLWPHCIQHVSTLTGNCMIKLRRAHIPLSMLACGTKVRSCSLLKCVCVSECVWLLLNCLSFHTEGKNRWQNVLSKLKGKIKGHCIIGPCLRAAALTPIRLLSLKGIPSVKERRMGHIPWSFSTRFPQLFHRKKQSQLQKLKVTFGGKGHASVSRVWKMVCAKHTPSVRRTRLQWEARSSAVGS